MSYWVAWSIKTLVIYFPLYRVRFHTCNSTPDIFKTTCSKNSDSNVELFKSRVIFKVALHSNQCITVVQNFSKIAVYISLCQVYDTSLSLSGKWAVIYLYTFNVNWWMFTLNQRSRYHIHVVNVKCYCLYARILQ